MKFLSLSEFKRMAEIGDATEDLLLTSMLEWISGQMELTMDRWIRKAQYTETVCPERDVVWVRAYPIDTSVAITVVDYGAALVKDSDFYVNAERGEIRRIMGTFTRYSYPTLRITYTGGFPEIGEKEEQRIDGPDAWRWACFLQTAYYFRNRKELGLNTLSVQGTSLSIAPVEWLPAVKEILFQSKRIIL